MDKLTPLVEKALSRRGFLTGATSVAAAAALAGCSDDGSATLPSSGFSDTDILNFALNLEYLEAEFYLRAATGSGLSSADAGGSGAGTVTGGAAVPGASQSQMRILNMIAQDELNHVRLLRSALGSAAVVRPAIDFNAGFNGAASAAGLGSSFNPFTSFNNFLIGAFTFEDVGVTAYAGAAPLLSSSSILNTAAGIQAVEAYHAGVIRTMIAATGAAPITTNLISTANAISTLRGTLGGGNETTLSNGLNSAGTALSGSTGSTIVAASSSTSVGYSRTPSQVLHIVYASGGGSGVSSGGFFPGGLNGNIKTTTA